MKHILFLPVLLICLFTSSCKKTLEEVPYDFLSPSNFYKSESDAIAAINGVYNTFYGYGLFRQPYWLVDLDSDHSAGADWFMGNIGAGNPAAFGAINNIWNDYFLLISRANNVIKYVPAIKMNEDTKNRVLGEAYFLRGWAYFELGYLYGGVPLREKTLSDGDEANKPRSSVAETFDFVVRDFKKAETMLFPASDSRSGEKGRVNKGIATAYLAKTYLFIASASLKGATVSVKGGTNNAVYTYSKNVVAGFDTYNSAKYFDSARIKSLEVINSKEYSLFPNFMDLWQINNRNQKEHMWEIQALQGNNDAQTTLNYYFTAAKVDKSNVGAVWMSNNFYDTYETQDERILKGVAHQWVVDYGTKPVPDRLFYPQRDSTLYKKDAQGNTYVFSATTYNKAYVEKYKFVTDGVPSNNDAFFPLLRFADVLLMYAEAENEVNGPTPAAY